MGFMLNSFVFFVFYSTDVLHRSIVDAYGSCCAISVTDTNFLSFFYFFMEQVMTRNKNVFCTQMNPRVVLL